MTIHQLRSSFQVQGFYGHISPIDPFAPISFLNQRLYERSYLTIQAGDCSRCLKYKTPLGGWTFSYPVHITRGCFHFCIKGICFFGWARKVHTILVCRLFHPGIDSRNIFIPFSEDVWDPPRRIRFIRDTMGSGKLGHFNCIRLFHEW